MKISTEYWPKPIPDRNHDWSAIDADTYDGEGSPIGYGLTEEAAIADLMEQIEDRENDYWLDDYWRYEERESQRQHEDDAESASRSIDRDNARSINRKYE